MIIETALFAQYEDHFQVMSVELIPEQIAALEAQHRRVLSIGKIGRVRLDVDHVM
ncbi:hypothetical protein [Dickeya fangzhongdai]|uniref:hypothetical protein n=1 Tax=Dickeya fangzhongdai TaxID=1778540 RepID=UPI0013F3F39E|nr:hypothetical protein [Dickeya fangzhongdai]